MSLLMRFMTQPLRLVGFPNFVCRPIDLRFTLIKGHHSLLPRRFFVYEIPLTLYSSKTVTTLGVTCQKPRYISFSSNRPKESEASTNGTPGTKDEKIKISRREQLKQAVRDYGATVIVFHIAIALISLGSFYLAVDNGLDVARLLEAVGFSEATVRSKIATEGSTMVIAYAVHKMFAPVRIVLTITVAPIIVRHLRKIGVLKVAKSVHKAKKN